MSIWEFLREHFWPFFLSAVYLAAAVSVTLHAVLWRRDARAVIGWVGMAWLAPFAGAVLYFCFGVNRIRRKAQGLGLREAWRHRKQAPLTKQELERRDEVAARYPNLVGLATLVRQLTEQPVAPGNRVEPLLNGDEAYPAMIRAIEGAQRSVSLLSYIFDSDRAGEMFADALDDARQRGVEVRVLIDDIGSRYSRPNMVQRLRRRQVPVASFLPTRVPRLFQYANLRNHRKLLVVDGRIGFAGGTNIRAAHCLEWNPDFPVSCLHFRLEGPVVAHLQQAFAEDWAFASDESLHGDSWFPELSRAGPVWARGISHGPDEDFEKMPLTILGALSAATRSVHVVTPYFLPDASIIHALNVAAMRGADVRILLPAENNVRLVQWASSALYWQLLEKGCRIFLSPPPFDHTKLLLIDGIWTLLGSSNWDPRSLRLNFEFNVECYDDALAEKLTAIVDQRIEDSRETTLREMNNLRVPVRFRNGMARLVSPYL